MKPLSYRAKRNARAEWRTTKQMLRNTILLAMIALHEVEAVSHVKATAAQVYGNDDVEEFFEHKESAAAGPKQGLTGHPKQVSVLQDKDLHEPQEPRKEGTEAPQGANRRLLSEDPANAVYLCVKSMVGSEMHQTCVDAGLPDCADHGYQSQWSTGVEYGAIGPNDIGDLQEFPQMENGGGFNGHGFGAESVIFKKSTSSDCGNGYYPFTPDMKVQIFGGDTTAYRFIPSDMDTTGFDGTVYPSIDAWFQTAANQGDISPFYWDGLDTANLPEGVQAAIVCLMGFKSLTADGSIGSSVSEALGLMYNRNTDGSTTAPSVADSQCRGNAAGDVEMWSKSTMLTNPNPVFTVSGGGGGGGGSCPITTEFLQSIGAETAFAYGQENCDVGDTGPEGKTCKFVRALMNTAAAPELDCGTYECTAGSWQLQAGSTQGATCVANAAGGGGGSPPPPPPAPSGPTPFTLASSTECAVTAELWQHIGAAQNTFDDANCNIGDTAQIGDRCTSWGIAGYHPMNGPDGGCGGWECAAGEWQNVPSMGPYTDACAAAAVPQGTGGGGSSPAPPSPTDAPTDAPTAPTAAPTNAPTMADVSQSETVEINIDPATFVGDVQTTVERGYTKASRPDACANADCTEFVAGYAISSSIPSAGARRLLQAGPVNVVFVVTLTGMTNAQLQLLNQGCVGSCNAASIATAVAAVAAATGATMPATFSVTSVQPPTVVSHAFVADHPDKVCGDGSLEALAPGHGGTCPNLGSQTSDAGTVTAEGCDVSDSAAFGQFTAGCGSASSCALTTGQVMEVSEITTDTVEGRAARSKQLQYGLMTAEMAEHYNYNPYEPISATNKIPRINPCLYSTQLIKADGSATSDISEAAGCEITAADRTKYTSLKNCYDSTSVSADSTVTELAQFGARLTNANSDFALYGHKCQFPAALRIDSVAGGAQTWTPTPRSPTTDKIIAPFDGELRSTHSLLAHCSLAQDCTTSASAFRSSSAATHSLVAHSPLCQTGRLLASCASQFIRVPPANDTDAVRGYL